FALLRKSSRPTAARYKLKKAIMELGPSGYPFERFVGEILRKQGYETEVGVIVKGYCVEHEVDVLAKKDDQQFMIECKFHNTQGRNCDVKIPLYIQSRFKDIEKEWLKQEAHRGKFHQGWLVNNTRFTDDALQYGNCAGLKLIGWDYPKQGSLKDMINISGLHPITCLTTLNKHEKNKLLEKDLVLSAELHLKPELLNEIGISEKRHRKILEEARELCGVD
ncbi:MAG: restriction endonuclease, partial [Chitinophagales bacterium]